MWVSIFLLPPPRRRGEEARAPPPLPGGAERGAPRPPPQPPRAQQPALPAFRLGCAAPPPGPESALPSCGGASLPGPPPAPGSARPHIPGGDGALSLTAGPAAAAAPVSHAARGVHRCARSAAAPTLPAAFSASRRCRRRSGRGTARGPGAARTGSGRRGGFLLPLSLARFSNLPAGPPALGRPGGGTRRPIQAGGCRASPPAAAGTWELPAGSEDARPRRPERGWARTGRGRPRAWWRPHCPSARSRPPPPRSPPPTARADGTACAAGTGGAVPLETEIFLRGRGGR